MALMDLPSESTHLENRNADFEAVNNSATFLVLVAFVAIVIAVPLAILF